MAIWLEVYHRFFLLGKKKHMSLLLCNRFFFLKWLETESYLEVREHIGMISNEESVRHVDHFLRVLLCNLKRRRLLISDYVVHERSSTGAWVSKPHGLG